MQLGTPGPSAVVQLGRIGRAYHLRPPLFGERSKAQHDQLISA